jgi:hypothetical protein
MDASPACSIGLQHADRNLPPALKNSVKKSPQTVFK